MADSDTELVGPDQVFEAYLERAGLLVGAYPGSKDHPYDSDTTDSSHSDAEDEDDDAADFSDLEANANDDGDGEADDMDEDEFAREYGDLTAPALHLLKKNVQERLGAAAKPVTVASSSAEDFARLMDKARQVTSADAATAETQDLSGPLDWIKKKIRKGANAISDKADKSALKKAQKDEEKARAKREALEKRVQALGSAPPGLIPFKAPRPSSSSPGLIAFQAPRPSSSSVASFATRLVQMFATALKNKEIPNLKSGGSVLRGDDTGEAYDANLVAGYALGKVRGHFEKQFGVDNLAEYATPARTKYCCAACPDKDAVQNFIDSAKKSVGAVKKHKEAGDAMADAMIQACGVGATAALSIAHPGVLAAAYLTDLVSLTQELTNGPGLERAARSRVDDFWSNPMLLYSTHVRSFFE